jgi:hypothetical protein
VAEEPAHLLATVHVPQPHRLVVTAREDALAVGREDGPEQLLRVPLQLPLLASAQLKDAQHVVHAAGQNELAVRRERHAGNPRSCVRERAEGAVHFRPEAAVAAVEVADVPAALRRRGGNGVLAHLLAGLHLPDAQVVVAEDAAANGPLAVGRERHGPHLARVPLEAADLNAGLQIPQPHGLVFAAGEQQLAVARHVQPVDRALVALVALQLLTGRQVPDADRPVATARNGFLAASEEGEAVHAHRVPLQLQ